MLHPGECASGPLVRSWIGMGDKSQQCPSMTSPPEISLSADIKNVGILINGSVPDLAGSSVKCDYGLGIATAATVHLDYGRPRFRHAPCCPGRYLTSPRAEIT
ncbi:hypothetical protein DPEC_G00362070 [Dallia pectoralis]|nr:hypothetical protein DPEC_G00362070 [Dallia pectoralis]